MFISGFEIQKSIHPEDKKTIAAVLIGSTAIPFIAGFYAPRFYDFTPFMGAQNNLLALSIIIAIAVSVTSIPVISKIFLDLGIMNTRFAKIILATATIHDIILWIALAIATGLGKSEAIAFGDLVLTVFITLTFFLAALFIMPRMIGFGNNVRFNLMIKSSVGGYALFICFFFAAVASVLNINIVFGAFLAGIVIGLMPDERFDKVKTNIKEFSFAFFVPIYFAIVGLRLDMLHNLDLLFFGGFLLFGLILETTGSMAAAKAVGLKWLSSFNIGVAMNARGGPGIVLATVAYEMEIINETFFVTLVTIAIVTSLIAGYWFKFVLSKNWALLEG